MTYSASEISIASGQPVELYDFSMRSSTEVWRYTSAAYDIEYLGNSYAARPGLHRGDIEDDEDAFSSELKIYIPPDDDLVNQYILSSPDYDIDFVLYRAHGTDFQRYWSGIVRACLPIDGDESIITVSSLISQVNKPCQYLKFCRKCSVILYSDLCGVDKTLYAVSGSVDSVSGVTVTSSTFGYKADDWFNGGWLVANGRRRKIVDHTANNIVLDYQFPELVAGMPFSAYPGCDHTYAVCEAKFGNGLNHKGYPWIVDNNPWLQRVFA